MLQGKVEGLGAKLSLLPPLQRCVYLKHTTLKYSARDGLLSLVLINSKGKKCGSGG